MAVGQYDVINNVDSAAIPAWPSMMTPQTKMADLSSFDQCLMAELQAHPASPSTMTMYEQEKRDMSSCYPRGSIDPIDLESPCDFDLKPQFEFDSLTDELFNNSLSGYLNESGIGKDPWETENTEANLMRMSDVFQVEDARQGPTLAELNGPKLLTEITTMVRNEQKKFTNLISSSHLTPTIVNKVSTVRAPSSTITSMENLDISHMKVVKEEQDSKEKWENSIKNWMTSQDGKVKDESSILRQSLKRPLEDGSCSVSKSSKSQYNPVPKKVTVVPSSTCSASTVNDDNDDIDEGFDSDDSHDDAEELELSSDDESFVSRGSIDDRDEPLYPRPSNHYFWQYNLQSKGPKGKPLKVGLTQGDPHDIGGFQDPVFGKYDKTTGYRVKHSGKARKGDGTDVRANPKKLFQLGNELNKLNKVINDMAPVSELPPNARPKTRKEKNKLASRACRLKKKAHHEANKVKLYGLEQEHYKLMTVLMQIKEEVAQRLETPEPPTPTNSMSLKLDKLIKTHLGHMIAGHTQEFVNSVVEKVRNGDNKGGLKV